MLPSGLTLELWMTLKRRSTSSNVRGAIILKRFKIDKNGQWTANRKQGVDCRMVPSRVTLELRMTLKRRSCHQMWNVQ